MDYTIRIQDSEVASVVSFELAETVAQAIANERQIPVDVESWNFMQRFYPVDEIKFLVG